MSAGSTGATVPDPGTSPAAGPPPANPDGPTPHESTPHESTPHQLTPHQLTPHELTPGEPSARDELSEGAEPGLRGLGRDDLRPLVGRIRTATKADDVPSLAAGVAFKIFLSLFPAMIAGIGVFSLVTTGADMVRLIDEAEVLPAPIREELRQPMVAWVEEGGGAVGAIAFGLTAGLWTASSAAATLMRALSRAFGVRETRSFLAQRLTAVVICLALLVAMGALVLLLIAGGPIQQALVADTPAEVGGLLSMVMTAGRYGAAVVVLMVLFAFIYWIGPDRSARPTWRWFTPGALVGVLGWLLLTAGFNVYTVVAEPTGNPAYAGLGGVIVLLLWLQLSMAVLLVGAEINAELRGLRVDQANSAPNPQAAEPSPAPRQERGSDPRSASGPFSSGGPGPASVPRASQRPVPAPRRARAIDVRTHAVVAGAATAAAAAIAWRARRQRR